MVILGVLAVAAVPALRPDLPEDDDLTAATRTLETVFRLARDSAARGGAPVTVVVDSATARVWFVVPPVPGEAGDDALVEAPERTPELRGAAAGGGTRPAFEPGAELDLPRSVRLELTRARATFTLTPRGLALGDSVTLRRGGAAIVLTLDPWTGDVVAF